MSEIKDLEKYLNKKISLEGDAAHLKASRLWFDNIDLPPEKIYQLPDFGYWYLIKLVGYHQSHDRLVLEEIISFGLKELEIKSVLFFGAGTCNVAFDLSEDYNICVYDLPTISFEFAKWRAAENKKKIHFLTGLHEGSQFDCIVALDVMEHLANPWETINFFKTLLKKNGYLIMAWARVEDEYNTGMNPWHLYLRPKDYFLRMVEEGFRPIKILHKGFEFTCWKWKNEK